MPHLDDPPICEPEDLDSLDGDLLAGRRHAHELAAVRYVVCVMGNDQIAFGDQLMDRGAISMVLPRYSSGCSNASAANAPMSSAAISPIVTSGSIAMANVPLDVPLGTSERGAIRVSMKKHGRKIVAGKPSA